VAFDAAVNNGLRQAWFCTCNYHKKAVRSKKHSDLQRLSIRYVNSNEMCDEKYRKQRYVTFVPVSCHMVLAVIAFMSASLSFWQSVQHQCSSALWNEYARTLTRVWHCRKA